MWGLKDKQKGKQALRSKSLCISWRLSSNEYVSQTGRWLNVLKLQMNVRRTHVYLRRPDNQSITRLAARCTCICLLDCSLVCSTPLRSSATAEKSTSRLRTTCLPLLYNYGYVWRWLYGLGYVPLMKSTVDRLWNSRVQLLLSKDIWRLLSRIFRPRYC